jgi:predicted ferric reductase
VPPTVNFFSLRGIFIQYTGVIGIEWASASLWFCGPGAFGRALRQDFIAAGLAQADFHQEIFEMR